MEELRPPPDPIKTPLKAIAVLVMLVIAVFGMLYVGRFIWMNSGK
jgi:hypothetical protein